MEKFEDNAHPESGAFEGTFADGKPETSGQFRGGQKQGDWKYYFRNGRLKASGADDDGKLTGHWVWWQSGERLQEGDFTQNRQAGPWGRWFDNGQLFGEGSYNDDGRRSASGPPTIATERSSQHECTGARAPDPRRAADAG